MLHGQVRGVNGGPCHRWQHLGLESLVGAAPLVAAILLIQVSDVILGGQGVHVVLAVALDELRAVTAQVQRVLVLRFVPVCKLAERVMAVLYAHVNVPVLVLAAAYRHVHRLRVLPRAPCVIL